VAVIATLQQIPVAPDLYNTIFGESALNDAVAVIVFRFTTGFAKPDARFSAEALVITGLTAIGVFVASVLVGITVGLILAKITKHCHVHSDVPAELGLTIIFATSSYAIAETLHLSGIVSILFCGMIVNTYVANNWTYETKKASDVRSFG
jgi:NhaP-type Na+/H+ or K+/H+ antiporter